MLQYTQLKFKLNPLMKPKILGSITKSRQFVGPTQSRGLRDSLLNEKKMWVDFRVSENPSLRRNSFALVLFILFYFFKIGKMK